MEDEMFRVGLECSPKPRHWRFGPHLSLQKVGPPAVMCPWRGYWDPSPLPVSLFACWPPWGGHLAPPWVPALMPCLTTHPKAMRASNQGLKPCTKVNLSSLWVDRLRYFVTVTPSWLMCLLLSKWIWKRKAKQKNHPTQSFAKTMWLKVWH
jgi:hypothetical protein